MKDALLQLLQDHRDIAILISLAMSIVVAVVGVLPSVFITAANILFFGFWPGTFISFLGEALGAVVAFVLYRKGFKKGVDASLQKFPKAQRLIAARGREAFFLIFSLRLLPFVPSGVVTFAGAVGAVSLLTFSMASSLGKIPALLLEAWSVQQVTDFGWQGKLILSAAALSLIYLALKKLKVF